MPATLSRPCPHCLHDRVVFSCVYQTPARRAAGYQSYWLCSHCNKGIGLIVYSPKGGNAPPMQMDGDASGTLNVSEVWPKIPYLGAPEHTPDAIAKRYVEAEDSFAREKFNSAAGMYRSALDIATKDIAPDWVKKSFFDRLRLMQESGRITKDMWEWASHVRVEGNDALHDPEDFTEADTKPLRFFTEMFLRYVYEMPGEVARLRKDTAPDAEGA